MRTKKLFIKIPGARQSRFATKTRGKGFIKGSACTTKDVVRHYEISRQVKTENCYEYDAEPSPSIYDR